MNTRDKQAKLALHRLQQADESLEEAGKRELYEETGLKGKSLRRIGI